MFRHAAVAVALLASYVAAQSGGTTANSTIDPTTIDPTMRGQWCAAEINTCGTLCSGTYEANNCNSTTLAYNCTCSNGSAPGLVYYQDTLPWFICEEIYTECITAGENDQAAQNVCTQNRDKNCGTLDPANFTAAPSSTSSSSSSATATAAGSSTAPASATSSSSSKAAAATMLAMGREYGSGVVAVGVAAAFGLML